MESVIRHCSVMSPKEFAKANNEGDDAFLGEYEYDIHWHSFKRLADIDNGEEDDEGGESDEDWNSTKDPVSETNEDMEYEEENIKNFLTRATSTHPLALVKSFLTVRGWAER
ncbi:hypothetical protein Tsubulata_035417 [Turnera subulata]|uniref:Uncharacterized protein n=1 Tax=Turnera subulata TaxID=218843 RepID=A0A9Q0FCE8_9ROSI|nr:hypothetical protein Tsubulata_035417 [Turnera subulata]